MFEIVNKKPHSKCLFLDSGHGMNTHIDLKSKFYKHRDGLQFHEGSTFIEGWKNKEYCDLIQSEASRMGMNVVRTSSFEKDTPLMVRCGIANEYHKKVQQGIFYSEHSNAFNAKAGGYCAFTSRGYTQSDRLAEQLINDYAKTFEESCFDINVRREYSDGDSDLEEDFSVLIYTAMPAILGENLFFDNEDDALILMNEEYKKQYVEMFVNWMDKVLR